MANAATQLQGQHKAPTVENVRQLLQPSSNSTIAKYLREWKAHQGIETQAEGASPAKLLALVKGLWQHRALGLFPAPPPPNAPEGDIVQPNPANAPSNNERVSYTYTIA